MNITRNYTWDWISGPQMEGGTATYGTLRSGSSNNIPGCRNQATFWLGPNNTLALFGGFGADVNSNYGMLCCKCRCEILFAATLDDLFMYGAPIQVSTCVCVCGVLLLLFWLQWLCADSVLLCVRFVQLCCLLYLPHGIFICCVLSVASVFYGIVYPLLRYASVKCERFIYDA